MGSLRWTSEDYAGITLITFQDSTMLDTLAIEQLGRELGDLAAGLRAPKLVLDFRHVKGLSSQMLGVLLTLHKKTESLKGQVVLCGIRPELMKVFVLTGLDKLFRFYPDDAAGLAAFGVRVG